MSDEDATRRAQDLTPNREALRALSAKLRSRRDWDDAALDFDRVPETNAPARGDH